ncbi:imidazole glycerol phosphate synthase subunit HisH [candidate division KSB1 bacterium]|nr:imidazole glycerol phosphate synthase subunit HisH [candidate division KSB1 bacterium]
MIAIVDYSAGNIFSVQKAVEKIGASARVTSDPKWIDRAEKIIFPGVGSFGQAMRILQERKLVQPLKAAIHEGKSFLGICLGLQLLFETSEESPDVPGLAVLPGRVRRFDHDLKIPHLGWNQVRQEKHSVLWHSIPDNSYFYFAHSFYVDSQEPEIVCGTCDYGHSFAAALQRENLFGVQFHPEKSQQAGLDLLRNFSNPCGVNREIY